MLHPNYHGKQSPGEPSTRAAPQAQRVHLRRKKDGLITIRDADGNLLSNTMKFIDFEAARSFLDHWVTKQKKQGK